MITKRTVALSLAILLLLAGSSAQASAFSPLAEKGSYFVRALNISVPLRDDLVWGPAFGVYYWNRNTIDSMRYSGRIYYPALNEVKTSDQYSIFFPPDPSGAPYPAIVFMQGANVSIEQYNWLFEHLASHGYIVLAITEYMASTKNLEGQFLNLFPPGANAPYTWLTSMTVPDIVTYLENINASEQDPLPPIAVLSSPPDPRDRSTFSPVVRNPRDTEGDDLDTSMFDGLIDVNKIVLGGHSFGGFMALMCANNAIPNPPRPEGGSFTRNVVGCFTYGAHSFTDTGTGFATPVNVPLLMLGGEKDGVAAGTINGIPYGGYARIRYTFDTYVPASGNGSRHVIGIRGANHLSIGTRPDPAVDRSFLDDKDGIISSHIAHRVIAEKVTAFAEYYARGNSSALPVITGSGSEPFVFDYAAK